MKSKVVIHGQLQAEGGLSGRGPAFPSPLRLSPPRRAGLIISVPARRGLSRGRRSVPRVLAAGSAPT